MNGNRDFYHDVDGLVDASIEAALKGETTYLGTMYGFGLYVHDWSLLLTLPHPTISGVDVSSLSRYLQSHGWRSDGSGGLITVDEGEQSLQMHYLNLNRITEMKEKYLEELRELSNLLEIYSVHKGLQNTVRS
ncbi:MAG: hypothetical protein HYT70_01925 [Candidatus Aenigmarchaeota archaeon]|nr:hypothetical protein [Candidatus Aenigmarchaeota archaeon]